MMRGNILYDGKHPGIGRQPLDHRRQGGHAGKYDDVLDPRSSDRRIVFDSNIGFSNRKRPNLLSINKRNGFMNVAEALSIPVENLPLQAAITGRVCFYGPFALGEDEGDLWAGRILIAEHGFSYRLRETLRHRGIDIEREIVLAEVFGLLTDRHSTRATCPREITRLTRFKLTTESSVRVDVSLENLLELSDDDLAFIRRNFGPGEVNEAIERFRQSRRTTY